MPTADATLLLPPPFTYSDASDSDSSEPGGIRQVVSSARHLEHVGVEAVLGAMIEQKRRASQPSFPAYEEIGGTDDREAQDDTDAPPSARTGRAPTRSEVFLKAR